MAACAEGHGLDARAVLEHGLPMVQGRGGGNALLAQGSGTQQDSLESALDAMYCLVETSLIR